MTSINWQEEVNQRKEVLFEDLFRLLRVPSVRDDELATEEAPVGPGPLRALEEFVQMAKEDGFEVEQFGPWAAHLEVGQGDHLVGLLGHVDVVPVGSGWETNPFEPVVKNNRIYARGSSDDKGPTMAAYFAIKLLRELGIEFEQRLRLIVGTDEETGWQCMDYYFQHAEMPDYGFSPDAYFPIINGEKGNVNIYLNFDYQVQEAGLELLSFQAGLRENMVPQDAEAVVQVKDQVIDEIAEAYENYCQKESAIQGRVSIEGDQLHFQLVGQAGHGSTPEVGVNAATYLARFLKHYSFDDQAANQALEVMADYLHLDFQGEQLGISHNHPVMKHTSMNLGLVDYRPVANRMTLNIRYPEGTNPATMVDQIQQTLAAYEVAVEAADNKDPHYVPADDPLVSTLLAVYEDHTGEKGEEMTIGGGTYARLMPRGVAYGALFPHSTDTMHQANEFIDIDDLLKATAIYADAIYRLTRAQS